MVERALVRVFRDHEPVGVGFLVSADLVLTCAHVVGDAPAVELDFPLLGVRARAEVVHRPEDVDLVGLRLDHTPAGARAVRVVAESDLRDHRVRTFGVPDRRPDGVWSQGVVRGAIAGGRIHVEDDRAHGLPMLRGFSGSPVIDDDLGAVVGMVVDVEARREHRIGYALSGAVLHDAWPELSAIANQPSPFRGLEPFQPEDAEHFFGRADRARELAEQLDRDGVLVVTGPSGCGKSSLVLAGLAAKLPHAVVIRPAGSPWAAAAAALGVEEIDADRAEDVVNRLLVREDLRRLTLVVDQFDEALTRFPDESADLLDTLLGIADSHHRTPRVDVVVTTTTEPLDRLLADPRFGSRLAGRTATLGTPSVAELREVVEGPLAAPGLPVLQQGLADALLDDLAGERNPLPLLEFTLTLLWERQERGVLTHRAYRDLGGVAGAVSTYAEQVWRRFDPDEVRRVLTQLVSPLPDGGYLRRAVPPDELGPIALELARTRLVTLGPDAVELVHEALVRHWDRLRGWVEEDREFRLWQDEVDRQATRWHDHRERALLLRGNALRQAWAMAAQRRDAVTGRQHEFVAASARGYAIVVAALALTAVVVLVLTSGVAYTVVRLISQQNAVSAANAAGALLTRAQESDFDQRVFDVLRAHRTSDTLHTRQSLRSLSRSLRHAVLLLEPTSVVNARGSRLARQLPDGRVELWDLAATTKVTVAGTPGATLTWTGDDALVVTAPGRPLVVLDARTGDVVTEVEADADLVSGDPTGRYVAYAAEGSTELHVLDLRGEPTARTAPGPLGTDPHDVGLVSVLGSGEVVVDHGLRRLALSTSGSRELSTGYTENLAQRPEPTRTGCDGARLVMEGTSTGSVLAEVRPSEQDCASGAFSPDGRAFAMVYENPYINPSVLQFGATDPSGPRYVAQVPNDAQVTHVEVEPSGAHRVLLAVDKAALVLRIPPPDDLDRALDTAHDARLTPDGEHVVLTGSAVEVWHVDSRTRTGRLDRPAEDVTLDSATVAVPEDGGAITLWNLPDLAPLGQVPGDGEAWLGFLDANRLAVVRGQEVGVWSARTGEPVGKPFTASGATPLTAVAVGDDQLAVVSGDKWVRRHAIADGAEVPGSAFRFGGSPTGSPVVPLAAADDLLAVPEADGVEVWDLDRGERLDRHDVPADYTVSALRFRDDTDEVEVTLDGRDGGGQADGGVQVELWTRDVLWGLPTLLGRSDETVVRLDVPAVPGYANAGGEYGGLESGDPDAWRAAVCAVVTRSELSEDGEPPAGSSDDPVC
ncbi:serine protease [Actinosynnema sp. NPDC002837]